MRHFSFLLILTGIVLFSGCASVGPDYEPPETDLPDAWHEKATEGLSTGASNLQRWWKTLGDSVLEGLIERAGANNLDVTEAYYRIEEAGARQGLARGEYYPGIDADGSYSRSRSSKNVLPPGTRITDQNLFSLGFDASWEIDVFGRVRRSVESTDAALQGSREDYRDVLVTLYAEVALGYIDVRSLQMRIALARRNVEAQRRTLGIVNDRLASGLAPRLDVAQAESNLANSESLIPSLETALIRACNRLSVLLGETPGALQEELLAAAPVVPVPPEKVLVGLPAELLRQRPDIRGAERALAAQHAQIGVATADLYPRFSLTGFFAWQARESEDLLKAESRAFSVGPSIRWNLFDGSRIRSAVRIEEARTRQALQRYERTVLLALEEVEDLMADYRLEQVRRDALLRSVEALRESVSIVEQLYADGLTDFQNVLDTQRTLLNQEDRYVESMGLVVKNLVSLYRALGGGWDPKDPVGPD